jgi:hypothetical protein
MAELRFAGGGGDQSGGAVHSVWNSLSDELRLSPAVASM